MRRLPIALLSAILTCAQVASAQTKDLPRAGEVFPVDGRTAFVIEPSAAGRHDGPLPWVWYAPTLRGLPSRAETWMFNRFLGAFMGGDADGVSTWVVERNAFRANLYLRIEPGTHSGKDPTTHPSTWKLLPLPGDDVRLAPGSTHVGVGCWTPTSLRRNVGKPRCQGPGRIHTLEQGRPWRPDRRNGHGYRTGRRDAQGLVSLTRARRIAIPPTSTEVFPYPTRSRIDRRGRGLGGLTNGVGKHKAEGTAWRLDGLARALPLRPRGPCCVRAQGLPVRAPISTPENSSRVAGMVITRQHGTRAPGYSSPQPPGASPTNA